MRFSRFHRWRAVRRVARYGSSSRTRIEVDYSQAGVVNLGTAERPFEVETLPVIREVRTK